MSKKTNKNKPQNPVADKRRELISTVMVTLGLMSIMVAAFLPSSTSTRTGHVISMRPEH